VHCGSGSVRWRATWPVATRTRLGANPVFEQELFPALARWLLSARPRRSCHSAARRNEPGSQKYVAAQNLDDPGVLILEPFAGAAYELDAAVIANPYDPDAVAEALQTALRMTLGERCTRWRAMIRYCVATALWRGARVSSGHSALTEEVVRRVASLQQVAIRPSTKLPQSTDKVLLRDHLRGGNDPRVTGPVVSVSSSRRTRYTKCKSPAAFSVFAST